MGTLVPRRRRLDVVAMSWTWSPGRGAPDGAGPDGYRSPGRRSHRWQPWHSRSRPFFRSATACGGADRWQASQLPFLRRDTGQRFFSPVQLGQCKPIEDLLIAFNEARRADSSAQPTREQRQALGG